MPLFNVHLYREMRCFFPKIEAADAEAAAKLAEAKSTDEADYTEDCDGTTLSALVDELSADFPDTESPVDETFIPFDAQRAIDNFSKLKEAAWLALEELSQWQGIDPEDEGTQKAIAELREALGCDDDAAKPATSTPA